ncbi:AMSH-like protease [Wickerhamomyces ciferrii]|uniref:Regulator of free ubiquitin chains 1 n=1 Tax=Wickerhamomyces ciferrii (strain ATCC 14091 / BCRC 22168 / CBS 111 / JCM 3599 / NBRC 0793 / NRRL Y-1031 F-60-10) TaxID=1206466 RepID=K0KBM7_WICCF|nr:AMSH-like protease [Wickerhamomyces ciferrii]CCH42450.1 AMSH-like protease [Wickerhamomyces ciferrii]
MVSQIRSIKELVDEAHDYEYSTGVPLKIYLRTAENLSRHNPQLKKGSDIHKNYLKLLSSKAPEALNNAEEIKSKIIKEIEKIEHYSKLKFEQDRINKLKQQLTKPTPKPEAPRPLVQPQPTRPESPLDLEFDEEKFAQKLKQFHGYSNDQQESSSLLSNTSYPTLEHHYNSQPQFYTAPQTLAPKTPPPKIPLIEDQPIEPSTIQDIIKQPQHKSIASTEGNKPLKTIYLPSQLPLKFLKISQGNTSKNLETCGILCGSLSLNAFFITTLLIPQQKSTSNTCETLNEEDIFTTLDSKDLFILGWIHTHPTQSCFLSSVDLHTQNSYQIMLPEAIAIVCAVKFGEMGQFRLTDPPGIGIITKCQKSGFHPHDESNIYKHCERKFGGHVVVNDTLPFDVIDLRK